MLSGRIKRRGNISILSVFFTTETLDHHVQLHQETLQRGGEKGGAATAGAREFESTAGSGATPPLPPAPRSVHTRLPVRLRRWSTAELRLLLLLLNTFFLLESDSVT